MKNLSDREKSLLALLAFALLIAFFYNFLLYPKWKVYKLAEENLGATIRNYETIKSDNKISNSQDNSVNVDYKKLEETLKKYADDYSISGFMQEELILSLNDFAVSDLEVSDNTFKITKANFNVGTKNRDFNQELILEDEVVENNEEIEEFEDSEVDTITNMNVDRTGVYVEYLNVELEYYSSYDALVSYVNNIEKYSKAVIINNLTLEPIIINRPIVTGDEPEDDLPKVLSNGYVVDMPKEYIVSNGLIRGTMDIQFVNIPIISDYVYKNSQSVLNELTNDDSTLVQNPFNPYSDFTNYVYVEEEEEVTENFESYVEVANEIIYTPIYDFEDLDYFFVGRPTNVKGSVGLSNISYSGSHSGSLSYEFPKGVEESSVNLVFTNTIIINKAAKSIGLEIYDGDTNPYIMGVVIRDSGGVEYEVDFGAYEEGLAGWKRYYTELPAEISYPCVVSRVYLKTFGEKIKLEGNVLMDKLQVSY